MPSRTHRGQTASIFVSSSTDIQRRFINVRVGLPVSWHEHKISRNERTTTCQIICRFWWYYSIPKMEIYVWTVHRIKGAQAASEVDTSQNGSGGQGSWVYQWLQYDQLISSISNARQLLDKRFGNPYDIADAYRDRLEKWPKLSSTDSSGLQS